MRPAYAEFARMGIGVAQMNAALAWATRELKTDRTPAQRTESLRALYVIGWFRGRHALSREVMDRLTKQGRKRRKG